MEDLKEFKKVKLIDEIEHQGIGGATLILEKEGTILEVLDTNFYQMPIAMTNFVMRRMDIVAPHKQKMKVYYGHNLETNLGYFIAEDEIKEWLKC